MGFLCHSEGMKALKSKLASDLLADPIARAQLRRFLENKRTDLPPAREGAAGRFVIRRESGVVQVAATVVPKAAKAA